MTGTGQDRYTLADKMSSAWVAFARIANPNQKSLPNWPCFDNTQRATMIFSNECRIINDPTGEELRVLSAIQSATAAPHKNPPRGSKRSASGKRRSKGRDQR